MLRTLTSLFATLFLLAVPALAQAEEPTKSYADCGREPTDAEVAAAKGAFQAGNASFNEADYARALDYWEDAYRRDCTANPLLLNLARAYELAGRKRQAVVALQTFLAREPGSGEKDQINRRVEVLKKKIAEEDAAAAVPPPTSNPDKLPNAGPVLPPPPGKASPAAKRSAWPWVVMGGGAMIAIVGTLGYVSNSKKVSDSAKQCDNPNTKTIVEGRDRCYDTGAVKRGNDARAGVTSSAVIAGVGVAALGAGIVWYVLDGKRVQEASQTASRRPRLVPLVAPQFAGLSLSGVF